MKTTALFFAAIVAANLITSEYGPTVAPYVAFALIGADLTVRDALHERWGGSWLRIGALIVAGAALSYLLNADAGAVAVASVVAFVSAGVVDTLVYAVMRGAERQVRVTTSNIAAAAVDSVVFLYLAFDVFGSATWTQFCAKVAGGAVWALLLFRR